MTADPARVAAALDAIGWRAASDEPAAAVAPGVVALLAAHARHGDPACTRRAIAEHLRAHAHALDGSGTPVSAWEPTAAELMRRMVVTPAAGR